MKQLAASEVQAQKTAELGLDPTLLDLTSIEALSAAIRRAASYLCPCTGPTLARSVVQPLRGLIDDLGAVKESVEETLEALIAHGDLLEHRPVDAAQNQQAGSQLYAAPPSFVPRSSGGVILLGVVSDQLYALPAELEARIEYSTYVRRLQPKAGEILRDELLHHGLLELSSAAWLRSPRPEGSWQYLARINRLLDAVQPSRDVPGLILLDSDRPVRYYRGRWDEPRSQSGRFVARRTQAYGAPLWCYVEMKEGRPERLIDLPISVGRLRGCDEAWHLQMAIDAHRGSPQRFRIAPGPRGSQVFQLFSPVPMWARRRWDAVGEPIPSSGCLFAYRLLNPEVVEEARFAHEVLWLEQMTGTPSE
jgi:hypothetical protein